MYLRAPSSGSAPVKSPTHDLKSDHEQAIANRWVQYFTSCDNRHALPLFTSLLNIVCGYDPSGILPYNHLLFNDSREELVEVALQVLVITLDQDSQDGLHSAANTGREELPPDNLFLNYLSRIHREEDFNFILKGVTRLLMNPLIQTVFDGELSEERTEPIAADAREGKDGKRNALLKLVAGLLGVGFDELKPRDAVRRQRRMMMVAGVSGVLALVMGALAIWAWDQRNEAVASIHQTQPPINPPPV
jgi:hypothetical protein